ncbi:hypothetical protein ATANTOWER_016756, partial [Ataeniobius toweri]|nr:hypothetical protein [Ataeniobius toweri]
AIGLYSVVRLIPIVTHLREGFNLYGVTEFLSQHEQLCQELFVPGSIKKSGCRLHNFLQNLEDRDADLKEKPNASGEEMAGKGSQHLSLQNFFQWVTGHAHIPLIESQQSMLKITSNFEHNCNSLYGEHGVCYPVVNACGVSVTFPICHLRTYSDFEKNLSTALEFGYEFSRY